MKARSTFVAGPFMEVPMKVGAFQVGSREDGAFQAGSREVGATQIRLCKVKTSYLFAGVLVSHAAITVNPCAGQDRTAVILIANAATGAINRYDGLQSGTNIRLR